MGKNKDKKKKGSGMEKTLAKTEKKIQKNIKKELDEIGEDDVEKLIAEFNEKEKQLNQVKEEVLPIGECPSRRGGSTFSLNQERDELVLFGGEYYNGAKVAMYNDLFIYSIKKGQWTKIKAPNGPPPRTFHQAAIVSRNMGELYVFGGEFSSPSQSQFYHYNDLWVFHFQSKKWTKINAPNGPSARSGHRMAVLKKYLVVFGGYYDNLRSCRFYNDTYLFNLETLQWEEMKFTSTGLIDQPSPRSACQLSVCVKTNSIIVYGGFNKEKLKKEKEKAITHSDMFTLQYEVKKNDKIEWSWKKVKQTGFKPSERVSFSMVTISDEAAILFGGVYDLKDDDEENDDDDDENEDKEASSMFYNDLYKLDLTTFKWTLLTLRGKKEIKTKKPKAENQNNDEEMPEEEEAVDESPEDSMNIEELSIEQAPELPKEDDVFQLTYTSKDPASSNQVEVRFASTPANVFLPHPRRSCFLQYHKSMLYLFGGKFEDKFDKEITLNDMYALNLKKLDEWNVLSEDKEFKLNQLKNSSPSSDEEDDEDEDESDMEIDAPKIEPNETLEAYYQRTNELWLSEASSEFPEEKSKKILRQMAFELCTMFYENLKAEETASATPVESK